MKKLNLLKDNERKIFFHYLIPAICSTLVTSIYVLVDTLIIGQGVGPLGISALNIFLPFFLVFNGIGLLFGIGSGILISTENGIGNVKKANKYFVTSTLSVAFVSILMWFILNKNIENLCVFLGADKSNLALVLEYAKCIVAFVPAFILSNYFSPIIRNLKNPKLVMIAVLSGSILNIILDFVFVFPMQMGMFGAALATVLGSVATVFILLTHFCKKTNRIKINPYDISINLLKPVFKCGISSLLMELASGFVIFIFNIQILKYIGNNGIVIYGIISNCVIVGLALFNGVAQAIQPIVAANYGAGSSDRINKFINYALITTCAIGAILFALVYFFTEEIINLFVSVDRSVIELGIPAIRIYLSSFCIMNINILIASFFQSVGKEKQAISISIIRGFLLNIVFALIFPIVFSPKSLWLVVPISEVITLLGIYIFNRNTSYVCLEKTA